MFKSIFAKLLATYLTIIITMIAVLSLFISLTYTWYLFSQKQSELEKTGSNVNVLVNQYENKTISSQEFNASLDAMGAVSDSKIYIIRINKAALADPQKLQLGQNLDESTLLSAFQKILNGENVFQKKQYSPEFDTYVVFSGIPWKTDTGIEGAILLFSPISQIYSNITKLNLLIWLTALILILLSAVLIYFSSQRISKPIKEIERAAERLASGEDSGALVIQSADEVGKLARSFNYMKEQLSNTEKMRREFIANVSHDMRTPLTSINGFVSGILDGLVKPEDYQKYLHLIKDETLRLTRLTNEILQLAKIQSGSLKLQQEHLPVADLLNFVLNGTKALLNKKEIEVTVECEKTVTVYADSDKLKQVLINIVENAVKYSGQKGRIAIQARKKQSFVEFRIKDDGIGISPADLPFIFEKFYRADKSRQSSPGGTGLGLNIAKSLIELQGGKIWAVSELGAGTEILFELPV